MEDVYPMPIKGLIEIDETFVGAVTSQEIIDLIVSEARGEQ